VDKFMFLFGKFI